MTRQPDAFEAMIETMREATGDPDSVTVGAFADAVQRLQAELRMIETQVDRLGEAADKAFGKGPSDKPVADAADQRAANRL